MTKLGCLLMIAAMVILGVVIVLPTLPLTANNADIDRLFTVILCQHGETVERDQYTTSGRGGSTAYTMSVFCHHPETGRRDVSGTWLLISLAIFLVPFMAGFFTVLWDGNRPKQPTVQATFATVDMRLTLAERLRQLEAARERGMISNDEYEQMRAKILNEMG